VEEDALGIFRVAELVEDARRHVCGMREGNWSCTFGKQESIPAQMVYLTESPTTKTALHSALATVKTRVRE
jgi:hypothetical protein